jgi:hypothetical protein
MPPQSLGHDAAVSHERAHTPSPHLAHDAAAAVFPPPTNPDRPREIEPRATAPAAAAMSNALRRFMSPSIFEAWVSETVR